MMVKEVYDGFETYIECEFEDDFEREIFEEKCGRIYIIQFVNDHKMILKEIHEGGNP